MRTESLLSIQTRVFCLKCQKHGCREDGTVPAKGGKSFEKFKGKKKFNSIWNELKMKI